MATETNAKKIQKARSAGEMYASIAEAIDSQRVPQFREFISGVVDEVGLKEIVKVYADAIKEGNDAARKKYARDFADLLKQYQQLTGEVNKDEIARMSDECIEQMLIDDFGFVKGNAMRDAAGGVRNILERHGCSEAVWTDVVALLRDDYGVELDSDGLRYQAGTPGTEQAEVRN